jgi:ATP-dependent RNA helicase DOB1
MEIPFKLDPFQAHAVNAIHRDENVLVTAKTGSGKTFVGEYQIAHSLARGGRVFYTTPIKSLSNQKFHDLKAMFPSVGIMTGDIKFRPDAAVVIMTTEILRNLLYKQSTATAGLGITASLSLDGLDAVVFDECHYINDRDRGRVWEETLILLPPAVKLVLLSATIDGPEAFGQWLAELKGRPVHLLSTQYRIVPLLHGILNDDGSVLPILTESETFQEKNYKGWLASLDSAADAQKQHRDAVADRRRGGYDAPVVKRKSGTTSYTHTLNKTIRRLEEDGNLPALFFVLSRADCAKYANLVEGSLLTSSDTASVEHILDFHLHRHMEFLQPLEQYHSLRRLLTRGIAYHHSGLVPLMKEIIELLFSKGFVKVLFATETFAVGINMPTKTVVFTSYRKYDDQVGGMRVFRTDEYIQMAGRAGRRGKDTRGIVLYLPAREPESVETVQAMMCGGKARIKSQMRFGFEFLLKVLHNPTIGFDTVFTNSYWNRQHQVYIRGLEQELSILRERLDSRQFSPADVKEMRELEHLKTELRGKTNKAQKVAQRALDQWRADHDGQRWKWLEEAWPAYVQLETDLASLEATYADALHEKDIILEQLADLEKLGFWDSASKTLTSLGQMATEVNEGHPILMPLIFQTISCRCFGSTGSVCI